MVWDFIVAAFPGFVGAALLVLLGVLAKLPEKLVDHSLGNRIEKIKHGFEREIEGLRARLALVGERGSLSNQREYAAIIAAWEKYVEAYNLASHALMAFTEMPQFEKMNDDEADAYLKGTELHERQQKQVMDSNDRSAAYGRMVQWRDLNNAAMAIQAMRDTVAKQSIFIPKTLEDLFLKSLDGISVPVGYRRGQFMYGSYQLPAGQENPITTFMATRETLLETLKIEVRARLLANLGETDAKT